MFSRSLMTFMDTKIKKFTFWGDIEGSGEGGDC